MPDPISITSLVLQVLSFLRRLLPAGDRTGRIVVTAGHGFEVWDFSPGGLGELVIHAHVTNDGDRPVVIESGGLTLDNGSTVLPPPVMLQMLPRRLFQGEKQSCLFQIRPLIEQLVDKPELGLPKFAWFKDSANREYRCKIPTETRKTVENYLSERRENRE